jgi:hypothetical protein
LSDQGGRTVSDPKRTLPGKGMARWSLAFRRFVNETGHVQGEIGPELRPDPPLLDHLVRTCCIQLSYAHQ